MSIQYILDQKMSEWASQNTTGKKVLFLNEYSNVFYQNPQSELFKVCMAFRCVDRVL